MEADDSEKLAACNPQLPENFDLELGKIKGDAIGDTLYSERWVIKTLMKVIKFTDEEWSEDFEKEMCALWDMTLEKDVVDFLMGQNVFTIINDAIKLSNNSRFIEILVGILGNMCCVERVRVELLKCKDLVGLLLSLFDRPDPLVLIQLVRLLHSVAWDLTKESSLTAAWIESELSNQRLTSHLFFILNSSTNEELLCCVLEFLNTLCGIELNDKDFTHYFCSPEMIQGMLECWKELYSDWRTGEDFPSKQRLRTASHWTTVLASFSAHQPGRDILCSFGEALGRILKKIILRPEDCIDDILISAVSILDTIIGVYFDGSVFRRLLHFMNFVYQNIDETDFADEDSDRLKRCLLDVTENYCLTVKGKLPQAEIRDALSHCPENHVLLFWKCLNDKVANDSGERAI